MDVSHGVEITAPMAENRWSYLCQANSWEEGNPLDAFIFLMLTLAGIFILLSAERQPCRSCQRQCVAYHFLSLLFRCDFLVGLSLRRFQALDQGARASSNGTYNPFRAGSEGSVP